MIFTIDSSSLDQFVRNYSSAIGIAITIGLLALLASRMLIHESGQAVTRPFAHVLDGFITFLLIIFVAIVAIRFHVLA